MKKSVIAIILLYTATSTYAQTQWGLDPTHSKLGFNVSHMTISDVDGSFKGIDGQVTSTKEDFEDAVIEFTADVNSINTDMESRDKHLKSDDFFNAEKFPKIIFKSTSLKKVSGNKYKLTGNLTIRDITKPVSFDVTYNGTVVSPYKKTVAGFKLSGSINRFDYQLKWNTKMDSGGLMVGETVNIVSNIEMVKK